MNLNNWPAYAIGGAYLLLLGALATLLVINADLRAAKAADDAARALLVAQNKEWARKTAVTNAALAKIHAADAANAKAIAKAQEDAARAGKKLKQQAATIANFSFTGSDCEQMQSIHNAYLELQP
jgi:hypothetical protein